MSKLLQIKTLSMELPLLIDIDYVDLVKPDMCTTIVHVESSLKLMLNSGKNIDVVFSKSIELERCYYLIRDIKSGVTSTDASDGVFEFEEENRDGVLEFEEGVFKVDKDKENISLEIDLNSIHNKL